MDVHLMLHEVKLQQYRHTLGKLKWAIDRMRDLPWSSSEN
jgi:hypothetical protein